MRYRSFEINYLISLLSSVLNKRVPPNPVRATDWRELFYLGEYHDVTNLADYALIALYDEIPAIWKDRYSKVFRKWVTSDNVQQKEAGAIWEALEDNQVDFMVLKDWLIKRYYPQTDMRAVEDIEVLVKPGAEKAVRKAMSRLNFHYEGMDEDGTMAFYKSINCRIVFYQCLFPGNRKLRVYFSKVWKRTHPVEEYSYQYVMGVEDFYIYMMAAVCDEYARGLVDARDIIDIHMFLAVHKPDMNRTYVDTELGSLELVKMAKALEEVGEMWLGVYEGDDPQTIRDVEEYIWSKGAYGVEASTKLLPMIQDIKIWEIQDARRARFRKAVRWFFPKPENMMESFPGLERSRGLLPLYWLIRLARMSAFSLKIRFYKIYRFLILSNKKTAVRQPAKKKPVAEKKAAKEETAVEAEEAPEEKPMVQGALRMEPKRVPEAEAAEDEVETNAGEKKEAEGS